MTLRTQCCIPFCKRTKAINDLKNGHTEWICQKHWPLISKELKSRKKISDKIHKRKNNEASFNLSKKIWEKCKNDVIEKSFGI